MYYGQQNLCRWLMANSFEEIQSAPVPMDGSQTMFMLTNEPIFYIVSFVNGQKMISGYTFSPLNPEEIKQAFERFLKRRNDWAAMGEVSASIYEEKFETQKVIQRFVQQYSKEKRNE